MKIWLLLSRFEDGGLERVQVELARAMREHGLDTQLIVGYFRNNSQASIPQGIPWRTISHIGRGGFPFGLFRSARQERPDIVFTTSNDVACLLLAMQLFALTRTRIVVTQHLSLSGPRKSATGLNRCKLEAIRWLMRRLIPRADRIVAVTKAVAHDMSSELSIPVERIDVIHNPAVTQDTALRMQESVPWPWHSLDLPTIVFVGRLAKVKRLDLLINAFDLVRSKIDSRLLIVGAGPMESWIRNEIETRSLGEHCALVGHHANPLPFMRGSDLLVLPSDHEGFGLVLVEAMACGTQVVATDCPDGPAEILESGKYGQLVPCGDATALATAILNVLSGNYAIPKESLVRRSHDFTLENASKAYLDIVTRISDKRSCLSPG